MRGLHEFLDWVQLQLRHIQDDIADAFWTLATAPIEPATASVLGIGATMGTMSQTMGTQTMGGMTQTLGGKPSS